MAKLMNYMQLLAKTIILLKFCRAEIDITSLIE